jgi:hypothetical protein
MSPKRINLKKGNTMSDEKVTPEEEAAKAKQAQEAEAARIAALEKDDLLKEIAKLNSESANRRVTNNELQEKLDKIEADRKAAEEAAAAEKGEFKTLYESQKEAVEAANAKAEAMTATLQKMLDAEVALIPENMRGLVPAGDVTASLEWIATAKAAGFFTTKDGGKINLNGEDGPDSLEAQYAAAEKDGNVSLMIKLKNQIAMKQQ